MQFPAFILTLTLAFGCVLNAQAASHHEILDTPRDPEGRQAAALTLSEMLEKYHVPAVSVAVIDDFKIVFAQAYGVADVETAAPATPETLFQAASISKPVAAMATLAAAQDGLLDLDAGINTILKSWKLPECEFTKQRAVTPAMLLSHTGGTTVHGFPGYALDGTIPTAVQVLAAEPAVNTAAVVVDILPGSQFRYSGGGVTIMQVALCDIVDKPFAEIMREWVLTPIGMTNSTYEQPLPESLRTRAARAHTNRGEALADGLFHVYPEQAAAGLWTTPTDLCKFAIEVQLSRRGESNKVLLPHMNELMITARETANGPSLYGLGFSITSPEPERGYFEHGGSNAGFRCLLKAHKRRGYGYAIMTNSDTGAIVAQELAQRLETGLDWEL